MMKIASCSLLASILCGGFALAQNAPSLISAGRAVNLDLKGVSADESARFRGTYPVSEDGNINLPNLDRPVRAAGLTAAQLSLVIENAYRAAQIYRAPKVQVISDSTATPEDLSVTIGGQVKRSGPVKFTPGMTLYQGLQAGGGATEFGSMHTVLLIRDGKSQTLDLTKLENKNLPMKPNDTVEVQQKSWTGW